jgi:hypothetical protein
MTHQFAIATEWPDDPRRYLVHLQRPYFVAEAREAGGTLWFFITRPPAQNRSERFDEMLRAGFSFFRHAIESAAIRVCAVEGRHRRELPRYLFARTAADTAFIVEPDYSSPLVELKDAPAPLANKRKSPTRFDVITQWRLAQMRKYYQQFLERQRPAPATTKSVALISSAAEHKK